MTSIWKINGGPFDHGIRKDFLIKTQKSQISWVNVLLLLLKMHGFSFRTWIIGKFKEQPKANKYFFVMPKTYRQVCSVSVG